MNRRFARLLFCAICFCTPVAASADNIAVDTVPVGDSGNVADAEVMTNDGPRRYGAIGYNYRIGRYEVTNAQYAAFLNAKAASDPLALYDTSMGSNVRGGITRNGSSGSFTYATRENMGNKPVNFVSWYDAIRFANWLHNGQGAGDTETGAYTLLGGTPTPSNGPSITRNEGATWFLTSADEWYKAAYYQPADQGGDSDNYWLYATATNSAPTVATANSVGDISNPGPNVANYLSGADWNSLNGNVTTVGSAGPLSESYYGTSDQGGNLWEWNESPSGPFRHLRGGSYTFILANELQSLGGVVSLPDTGGFSFGFRVATIPEPSTLLLAATGLTALVGVAMARRRRR